MHFANKGNENLLIEVAGKTCPKRADSARETGCWSGVHLGSKSGQVTNNSNIRSCPSNKNISWRPRTFGDESLCWSELTSPSSLVACLVSRSRSFSRSTSPASGRNASRPSATTSWTKAPLSPPAQGTHASQGHGHCVKEVEQNRPRSSGTPALRVGCESAQAGANSRGLAEGGLIIEVEIFTSGIAFPTKDNGIRIECWA
jgi:hypothetical protein